MNTLLSKCALCSLFLGNNSKTWLFNAAKMQIPYISGFGNSLSYFVITPALTHTQGDENDYRRPSEGYLPFACPDLHVAHYPLSFCFCLRLTYTMGFLSLVSVSIRKRRALSNQRKKEGKGQNLIFCMFTESWVGLIFEVGPFYNCSPFLWKLLSPLHLQVEG